MPFRRRNRKIEDDTSDGANAGFAGGCLSLVVELTVWVVSTFLITVGVFLFLFGILDFSPDARFRTVVLALLVPLAAYILIRIGRQILDDLRGKSEEDKR